MIKVFVSYSRKQAAWVRDRMVPVLRAGGADVLIDAERFRLGHGVIGEMDSTQDQAERHVLCLSDDYLASDYCRHELERALAADPHGAGIAVPLRLDGVTVPGDLCARLYADFNDDTKAEPWAKLLTACDADLGIEASHWLAARDQALTFLDRGQSVNLLVRARNAKWDGLFRDIIDRLGRKVPWIDLEGGATTTRPDFLNEILAGLGTSRRVRETHQDPADFAHIPGQEAHAAVIALLHFDRIQRFAGDIDLSGAFRSLIMADRRLVLLVQSRAPFAAVLPRANELSNIDIKTVELA